MGVFQSLGNSNAVRRVGDFNLRLAEGYFATKDSFKRRFFGNCCRVSLSKLYKSLRSSDLSTVHSGLLKLEKHSSELPTKVLLPRLIQIATSGREEFKDPKNPNLDKRYKWVHSLAVKLIAKTGEMGTVAIIDSLYQTLSQKRTLRGINLFSEIQKVRPLKSRERSIIVRYLNNNFLGLKSEPYLPVLTSVPMIELRVALKTLKKVDPAKYQKMQKFDKENRNQTHQDDSWQSKKIKLRHQFVLLRANWVAIGSFSYAVSAAYSSIQNALIAGVTSSLFQGIGTAIVFAGIGIYLFKVKKSLEKRTHWRYFEESPLVEDGSLLTKNIFLVKAPLVLKKLFNFFAKVSRFGSLRFATKFPF